MKDGLRELMVAVLCWAATVMLAMGVLHVLGVWGN